MGSAVVTVRNGRAAPPRRSRNDQESFFDLVRKVTGPVIFLVSLIVGTAGLSIAWNELGWWKPASVTYVDGSVNGASEKLSKKIDDQSSVLNKRIDNVDANTLQNRLETITAAKNRDIAEKTDLELKLKVASALKPDPGYLQMIQTRMNFLDDQVGSLNNQISALSAAISGKNAPPGH